MYHVMHCPWSISYTCSFNKHSPHIKRKEIISSLHKKSLITRTHKYRIQCKSCSAKTVRYRAKCAWSGMFLFWSSTVALCPSLHYCVHPGRPLFLSGECWLLSRDGRRDVMATNRLPASQPSKATSRKYLYTLLVKAFTGNFLGH